MVPAGQRTIQEVPSQASFRVLSCPAHHRGAFAKALVRLGRLPCTRAPDSPPVRLPRRWHGIFSGVDQGGTQQTAGLTQYGSLGAMTPAEMSMVAVSMIFATIPMSTADLTHHGWKIATGRMCDGGKFRIEITAKNQTDMSYFNGGMGECWRAEAALKFRPVRRLPRKQFMPALPYRSGPQSPIL
jgi:hypothetical protein